MLTTLTIIVPVIQALFLYYFLLKPLNRLPGILKKLCVGLLGLNIINSYLYVFLKLTFAGLNFPKWAVMMLLTLQYTIFFVCVLVGVRMVINGVYKLIRGNFSVRIIPVHSLVFAMLLTFVTVCFCACGVGNAFMPPVDSYYSIHMDKLKPMDKGFKIVQLSDLHIDPITTKTEIRDIVQRVNEMYPDLIVITGDFADGSVEDLREISDILFELDAKYGVYAVSGNHEMYSGYKEWLSYLEKGGIRFLENTHEIIKNYADESVLNLCGIIDPKAERYHLETADIAKAIKGIDPSIPTVFLSHRPGFGVKLDKISDLTLSGHTHGGMMPYLDIIVGLTNEGMTRGLYKIGKEKVIVSAGTRINTAGAFRIMNDPQINIITLD